MTADEFAFLRLILAEPDADGPRLVYADWLDEHGHPDRAEFIRVQCALAQMPEDAPRREVFRQRDLVLREQYRAEWSGPLAGLASEWDFHRGFPDDVKIEARAFLSHAAGLFAALPIRRMELRDVAGHLPQIGQSQHLARLRDLKVSGTQVGNALPKALAASPHLRGLARLDLDRNLISDDGARALAATPNLAGLTALDLGRNEIGPAGATALAASPHLGRLIELRLGHNPVGLSGGEALLTSTRLTSLTRLDLGRTGCGPAALRDAAAAATGPRLAVLDLSGNGLGDAGAQLFGEWSRLVSLRDLDLSHDEIGNDGAAALAKAAPLEGLQRLALVGNRMTDVGKQLLKSSPTLRQTVLDLRENWSPLAVFRR